MEPRHHLFYRVWWAAAGMGVNGLDHRENKCQGPTRDKTQQSRGNSTRVLGLHVRPAGNAYGCFHRLVNSRQGQPLGLRKRKEESRFTAKRPSVNRL